MGGHTSSTVHLRPICFWVDFGSACTITSSSAGSAASSDFGFAAICFASDDTAWQCAPPLKKRARLELRRCGLGHNQRHIKPDIAFNFRQSTKFHRYSTCTSSRVNTSLVNTSTAATAHFGARTSATTLRLTKQRGSLFSSDSTCVRWTRQHTSHRV